jgi:hypothetical protein
MLLAKLPFTGTKYVGDTISCNLDVSRSLLDRKERFANIE